MFVSFACIHFNLVFSDFSMSTRLSSLSTSCQLNEMQHMVNQCAPSEDAKKAWGVVKIQVRERELPIVQPEGCIQVSAKNAAIQIAKSEQKYIASAPGQFIRAFIRELDSGYRTIRFQKMLVNVYLRFWRSFHLRAVRRGKSVQRVPPMHPLEISLARDTWYEYYQTIPNVCLPEAVQKPVQSDERPAPRTQARGLSTQEPLLDQDIANCYSFPAKSTPAPRHSVTQRVNNDVPQNFGRNRAPGKRISKLNRAFGEGFSFQC